MELTFSEFPREAYELLAHTLSESGTVSPKAKGATLLTGTVKIRVAYERENYPLVTIWTADDWVKHGKNKKSDDAGIHQTQGRQKKQSDKPRSSMFYIQDSSGVSVSERKASDICFHARTTWETLALEGLAPKKWKQCSTPAWKYYLEEMYRYHDDLRLCEGDWKAERLAVDNYSGWMRGRTESSNIVVKHESTPELPSEASVVEKKRKEAPTALTPIKPEKHPRMSLVHKRVNVNTTPPNHIVDGFEETTPAATTVADIESRTNNPSGTLQVTPSEPLTVSSQTSEDPGTPQSSQSEIIVTTPPVLCGDSSTPTSTDFLLASELTTKPKANTENLTTESQSSTPKPDTSVTNKEESGVHEEPQLDREKPRYKVRVLLLDQFLEF